MHSFSFFIKSLFFSYVFFLPEPGLNFFLTTTMTQGPMSTFTTGGNILILLSSFCILLHKYAHVFFCFVLLCLLFSAWFNRSNRVRASQLSAYNKNRNSLCTSLVATLTTVGTFLPQ